MSNMEMECIKFQITVHSATDLENVRNFFQPKVYALISIGGEPRTQKKTPVDKEGGTNPSWQFVTGFTIGTAAVKTEGVMLVIKLYCSRTAGDRYIGEVNVSLKDLFDDSQERRGTANVRYPVKKGAADSQGELEISYSFGEIVVVMQQPSSPAPRRASCFGRHMLTLGQAVFLAGDVIDIPIFGDS